MPRKPAIPYDVRDEVEKILTAFNRENFKQPENGFSARFKGKYLYLDRNEYHRPSPICRLQYNGQMGNWGFAIYKYSDNGYDPDEWMFPGAGKVDGTIEGAMQAGMLAYPM